MEDTGKEDGSADRQQRDQDWTEKVKVCLGGC